MFGLAHLDSKPWCNDYEISFTFRRLSERGRIDPVSRGRCRRRGPDLTLLERPAGLLAVAGLRAARDDAGACDRRVAARWRLRQPRNGSAPGHDTARDGRHSLAADRDAALGALSGG